MNILQSQSATVSNEDIFGLKYKGFTVSNFSRVDGELRLTLAPTDDPVCPNCGKRSAKVHGHRWREVRDVPFISVEPVYVRFQQRRVRCCCGCCRNEVLDWVEPKGRLTNAMVCLIQNLLRVKLPISDIADVFGLHWDTIKNYERLLLKHLFEEIDLSNVRHIAMDEFSVHKNHKYATVVMDLETSRVIWLCMGKTQKKIEPFFELLKQKGLSEKIESVSVDMNAGYPAVIRNYLPKAKILYDHFHVMKNFNEDVVKAAKRQCVGNVRLLMNSHQTKNKPGRKPKKKEEGAQAQSLPPLVELRQQITDLRGSEWLIMKHPEDLKEDRQQALTRLLDDNALLASVYPIVDLLRSIWKTRDPIRAEEIINKTRQLLFAINDKFNFKPAKRFAMMLKRRMEGYSSGQLEGANNKIKVLKRIGYGYRDMEYFFLKIKAVLPGNRNSPWETFQKGYAILKSGIWKSPVFHTNP